MHFLIIILTVYSAKIELRNTSPLLLLSRLGGIIQKLTGNVNFPTVVTALADQTTMCDVLEQAVIDADTGDRNKIFIRNQLFENAKDMFRIMVWYVTQTAQGDREIIRSAGLRNAKEMVLHSYTSRYRTSKLYITELLKSN